MDPLTGVLSHKDRDSLVLPVRTTWMSAPTTTPEPVATSQALRRLVQAAEHTRPLPGTGRNHHGATASSLPPRTTAQPTA
ncbi:hypothetical protein [Streptomyces griseocarneus]|uniref:hypothetical protein n=1 Tax=Streptomyces griseocarneus TaxID=51201 RepID=UPI00167E3591|nr:hypothetical protein [Streptomyces griseocarneus]MBZ6475290.1 hypothetical protein [Streptomyces griseocarneus]GHG74402.1 hypothetical protein GCM10018779_51090 [Streptomyces griseocarneus]